MTVLGYVTANSGYTRVISVTSPAQLVLDPEPTVFRAVNINYEDGRKDEFAFVPLMYGLTGLSPSEDVLTGRKTRFVAFLGGDGPASEYGIGLGQQNLMIRQDGQGRGPECGVGFAQQGLMIRQEQGH